MRLFFLQVPAGRDAEGEKEGWEGTTESIWELGELLLQGSIICEFPHKRKGLPWCWRRKDFLMVTLLIARGCLEDEGLPWGWTECSA